ncbi:MATE family efflux transporter [Anaerostipes sp.]|uniref:MATE family efflux transporter n=1 Tax=Anaerostipes sp. TaxID=1872530 RepID=UPI0025C40550|nr:MATE family efflux transporter [Anaerostipes sp.]MBS7007724.1 MATE family efflux transporter [Anaerostipes sp.]
MEQPQSVQNNPLAFESTGRLIAKYSVPSIIAMLVSSLYNIVDQIFIGQGVGMLGNAATNVAFPFVNICIALALLIGVGGASNFNLNLGRGENEKAKSFAGTTISLLILSGVILSVLSLLFLKPVLIGFGSTKQVLPYALTYTRITALGFPFLIATNGFCNLIRSDGSPRYSMLCMVAGAVINTCLDPLFIFGFGWGIAGGAAATVIGQIISCVMAAVYLTRFRTMKLTRSCLKIKADNVKSIVSIGIASFFNQIAMMAVQIALNNTLAYYGALSSYGSDIPLACAGVIIKVNAFVMAFAIGIAQGCQPILGFNYGAKLYARVRDTLKKEIIIVTVIFSAAFVCFQLLPRQIVSIFGEGSPAYFHFAERYFRIYLFMVFINGLQPVVSNFFSSIGKAWKGIFLSLTRQILFLLPLILILPVFLGIDGVMYAGPVADGIAAVTAFFLGRHEFMVMRNLELSSDVHPEADAAPASR